MPVPPPPVYGVPQPFVPAPRVQRHVQTLGILWCAYGAYRAASGILASLFLMGISMPGFLGGFGAPRDLPFMPFAPLLSSLAVFIVVLTSIGAVLDLVVGYSLLTRKPWGRILAIVIAILALIRIPFGTALGIYTLWVLAPSTSAVEYDALADRS
ncbi:MAG: hypothetical protein ACLQM6_06635 [Acidobacteriaceae bacterium]